MNFERFELKEIELSYGDLNESLRCLFHSIVFHRSLGGFRPIDHESEKFPSIVYPKSGDESLNTIIETGIQKINLAVNKAFQQLNNNNNNNNSSSSSSSSPNNNNNSSLLSSSTAPLSDRVSINVHLGFYELTLKKGWLGEKEEKVFWERWVIPITVTRVSGINNGIINNNNNINNNNTINNSNNINNNTNNISSIITEAMFSIISYVNEKKDHIPPLKQTQTQCSFPFEISFFIGNKNEESSWGSALTRMLKQGPPMLMKP